MLEIVEHQQQRALAQECEQMLIRGDRAGQRAAKRLGDRGRDVRCVGNRCQGDEGCAVGKCWRKVGGHLQRQAGFADAARADQGDQTAGRMAELREERAPLGLPPDQERRRGG